jgi:DNA mismatch repair protein MutL
MNEIALLSDEVINQIAAGEVIENPASVVKELVDNAIDANARRIEIEIHSGGFQLIKVDDDGCGMSRRDIELCLLRHATSKIQSLDDLDALQTMGFRGEALAAIGAVSKIEICTSDESAATRLISAAGVIEAIEPSARNRGTTIEVRSLFFNTPARRKFQKSPQASTAQIVRMVQSLSLSHPEIAFLLRSQGQVLLNVRASLWKERIEALLPDCCQRGIWIEGEKLFGLLGASDEARSTRLGQYFFLNRRPIFSPLLSRAAQDGYGTRLTEGAHPSVVLFLNRSSGGFDVNVHPQKREVRFHDEGRLFTEVKEAVQRAFSDQLPSFSGDVSFERLFKDPWEQPYAVRAEPAAEHIASQGSFFPEPAGRALAVIGSFLLGERSGEVFIVDLEKAYEKRAIAKNGSLQSLIEPITLALSNEEAERMAEWVQRCQQAGMDAKALGLRQLCVDAIPDWLDASDVPALFEALKEDLPVEAALCRFCRSAKKRFTLEEAEHLWKEGSLREACLEASDCEHLLARKV